MFRVCRHHSRHIDQIGNYRTRGRLPTGATAVVERGTDRIAFDHNCVHHPFDVGDQTRLRDKCRMYPQLNAIPGAPGDAKEFDAIPQLLRVFDIFVGELRNSFCKGLFELRRHTERNGRKNGQLVRSVNAFDVKCRIGFSVALGLSLFQHTFEAGPA